MNKCAQSLFLLATSGYAGVLQLPVQECQPLVYLCTFSQNKWLSKQFIPALGQLVGVLHTQLLLVENLDSHDAHTKFQNLEDARSVWHTIVQLGQLMHSPGIWQSAYTCFMRDPERMYEYKRVMEHVQIFSNIYSSLNLRSIRDYGQLKDVFTREYEALARVYDDARVGQLAYEAQLPARWPHCDKPLIDPHVYCAGYAADNASVWFDLDSLVISRSLTSAQKFIE